MWAAIGLTACKAPQLSPDGERAVLPEGDGHTYDTAFVKPLEWNVFFQDSILQGYVEVALQNNYSFKQSMERVTMSRANLQRSEHYCLKLLSIGTSIVHSANMHDGRIKRLETNVPSLAKDKHIPDPYRDFGLS